MSPALDTTYPALIVKISRTVIHHGALGVARTLGRQGVPVYAVVEDALVPLATSKYLTKAFFWERCPKDTESFVKAMTLIGESIARPTIVFPMDDLSAVFVAESAAQLARWFIVPRIPQQIPLQLASKARLHALCAQIGIPCARSIIPNSFDDVKAFTEGASFPLMVKTAEQWLPVNNSFCAKAIQTHEELFHLCKNHNYEGPQRLVIQEYIPGDDWICHGYYNFEKKINVTFTGKKLRGYPPDAGSTSMGLSVNNEELRNLSEKLLTSVGYSGITDMDWRRDQRDGKYKLLDCNPRVGQNFRMFENEAGIDVVRAQHLDLSGRQIGQGCPIEGRLFSVEPFRILALLRRLPWGASKQDAARYFPTKSTELAWWSSDDPLPFLVMILRLLVRTLGRALGRRFYFRVRSQLSRFFSTSAKATAVPRT